MEATQTQADRPLTSHIASGKPLGFLLKGRPSFLRARVGRRDGAGQAEPAETHAPDLCWSSLLERGATPTPVRCEGTPCLVRWAESGLGRVGEGPTAQMAGGRPPSHVSRQTAPPRAELSPPHPALTWLLVETGSSLRQVDRSSLRASTRKAGTGHRSGRRWTGRILSPLLVATSGSGSRPAGLPE